MKSEAVIFIAGISIGALSAQIKYDKIDDFGNYQADWATVEMDHKFGFIDKKGNVVVEPLFDSIGLFGDLKADWAVVTIKDKIGFIDSDGKIVQSSEL